MEFINVSDWMINEGAVLRVIDSFNRIIWEKTTPQPPENTYFYVEDASGSANTLTIEKFLNIAPTISVSYSTDKVNWTSMGSTSSAGITATIPANGKLYLKATANTWCLTETETDPDTGLVRLIKGYNLISASNSFNVGGNIMSLLYGDNFVNQATFPTNDDFVFNGLFYKGGSTSNGNLLNAYNLLLPATTLNNHCYEQMFRYCTNLITAPALPATTLANSCYHEMFSNCTSLTSTPVLPATTLVDYCYYHMFSGCTSLRSTPELPATTLAQSCYDSMFYRCSNLNRVITYANDISALRCLSGWLANVAASGDFYNNGSATYTVDSASGIPTGWTEHKTLPNYNVSISAGSNGTVSVNGVSGNYSQIVPSGTVLTIEGTGDTGYNFDEWSDGVSTNPRTITVTDNLTLTASFEAAVVPNYFYVEDISGSSNTLSIAKSDASAPTITVYKSTDGTNWTSMGNTSTTAITATIPVNGKLYLKATANYWGQNTILFNNITASGNHNVGGNSMSLLYGDNFANQTVFPTNDEFCLNSLFKNNTTLISAANLQLPSTTLTRGCYWEMFSGCTSLTTTPVLPATTLALQCYRGMFQSCSALTTAPALPATTLTNECYYSMFGSCTALTTAPTLPATTLVNGCYNSMFNGCTSLNFVKTYADNISATYCLYQWLDGVAPTGTFNNLGLATYTRGASGIPTGWTEVKAIYFYIEDVSGAANTLSIAKTDASAPTIEVFKSTDQQNWTSMGSTDTTGITATVPANGKLYLKATANAWHDSFKYNIITASGSHNVGGNIMSLVYGDNYVSQTVLPAAGLLYLFNGNTTLISASHLYLPATVTLGCYQHMFNGCTSLTTAPTLPATTLADYCYNGMFYGCTSLTTAPVLPATTLAAECYNQMFYGCTSLTTAPALPATTLAAACYKYMFGSCTALTTAPTLPATTLVDYCYERMFRGCTSLNSITTYANNISATDCLTNWLQNVAASGTFHNEGTAVYTTDSPSGIPTGWSEPVTSSGYFYLENTSRFIDDEIVITSSGNAPVFDIYYSYDAIDWDLLGTTGGSDIYTDIYRHEKIYLKAETSAWGTSTSDYITISSNAPHNVGGNIMSLLYGDNYENKTLADTSTTYNFVNLFVGDEKLVDASDLVLPSDVTGHCYHSMFKGCTSLTTAPTLNATTLISSCYREMFRSCSSLNTIITYASSAPSVNLMNWVRDVAASGDFYNLGGATYGSGNNGIPSGWTEHNSL